MWTPLAWPGAAHCEENLLKALKHWQIPGMGSRPQVQVATSYLLSSRYSILHAHTVTPWDKAGFCWHSGSVRAWPAGEGRLAELVPCANTALFLEQRNRVPHRPCALTCAMSFARVMFTDKELQVAVLMQNGRQRRGC